MESTPKKNKLEDTLNNIRLAIEKLSPSSNQTGHTKSLVPALFTHDGLNSSVSSESRFTVESSESENSSETHLYYSLSKAIESPVQTTHNYFHTNETLKSSRSASELTSPRFKLENKKENWELSMLLEYEKEKTLKLDRKIEETENLYEELNQKNQLLTKNLFDARESLTRLQNEQESYDIQHEKKISSLKSQFLNLENNYNNLLKQLNAKDQQIRNLELEKLNNERSEDEKIRKMEEFEREITRLIREKSKFSKDTEELQHTVTAQDRQIISLKSSLSDLQREISRKSSEKNIKETEIRGLLEDKDRSLSNLKREMARKEEEIQSLLKHNRSSDEELHMLKLKGLEDQNNDFSILKLKEKINTLTKDNENLTMQINQTRQRKLEEISDVNRNKSPKRSSPKRPSKLNKENPDGSVVSDILIQLNLASASEIMPAIRQIQASHADLKLIKRLSQLVKTCSPPGVFHPEPSAKQLWKWIRRLMEDYAALKKQTSHDAYKPLISRLTGFLRANDSSDLLTQLNNVLADYHSMQLLLDKIAVKLRLSPNSTLRQIEAQIDENW